MMNSNEKLLDLADRLENLHDCEFNMMRWLTHPDPEHGCNTVACIAGWAVMFYGYPQGVSDSDVEHEAAMLLGLDAQQAFSLFMPVDHSTPRMERVRPTDAAKVIREVVNGVDPYQAWNNLLGEPDDRVPGYERDANDAPLF